MSQARFNLSNPVHFLALGFGSGLLKPAPGTWGTLAGMPLLLLVSSLVSTQSVVFIALLIAGFMIGIYLCGKTASDIGVHDHGAIVWDEIVGLFAAVIWLPLSWQNLVLAFLLFRLFDIIKPWPIRWLDRHVHGGFGIMIDDVIAGLMACGVLHLGHILVARFG